MEFVLLFSAALMGLSGTPHCLAMCGATCGALTRCGSPANAWAFHLGRVAGYAAGGAVAASSVAVVARLGQSVAVMRPLWTLVHVLALGLGAYLLWQGRQPAWMERLGRTRAAAVDAPAAAAPVRLYLNPAARRGAAGLAWVAWPCGLLQSALMVAALANSGWGGAMVMTGFAVTSALGLVWGPALWWRLTAGRGMGRIGAAGTVRLAGLALMAASAWALGHGLWLRFWAWCVA